MTSHYLEKELYECVRQMPEYFDFLQQGSLDGIWYWDLQRPEHEWMSPEFWQLFGYDPATKQHLVSEWQSMIYPDDLEVTKENFAKHCADPDHPYDQMVRYRHQEGHTVWVRCRGIAIRDRESGEPIRMLGAHHDITPLMMLQQRNTALDLQLEALRDRTKIQASKIRILEAKIELLEKELASEKQRSDPR